ncbi:MAG: sensor histidine kinase [Solirubrobacterales bacterium]
MFLLPHSVCLALDPALLWLHVTADSVTALAYYSIPLALIIYALKRRSQKYRWVLLFFAAFVVACGTTHVLSIITLWTPIYWVQGWAKAATALVSIITAALLWPLIPKVLALPSPDDLAREVAERKLAEEEVRLANRELEGRVRERTIDLLQAKEEAERANQAKTRFLAAASHDLRQPFQALRLFLEVLNQRIGDDNRAVLAMAQKALEGGEGLLHALLDISTLQAGTVRPKPQRFKLATLLEQIAVEWGPQAERKGLELRVVPCGEEVESDPVLLERLVRNLVSNALRYTPSGRILVGCRRRGDRIAVEVWDCGMGIPAEARTEIFEEFTQLGNPERDRTKGLGLGLAIVRRLAVLLGIELSLDSTPGRGSVFRALLPAAVPTEAPLMAEPV